MNKRLMQRFALMNADDGNGAGGGAAAGTGSADAGGAAATGSADATAATGGAATGAAATGATGTQDSAQTFADSLGDAELKAFVESKGYASAADAIKALRDAQTANARPETPDAYELPVPEGEDPAFSKVASAWFHEAGISKEAAQALAGKFNAYAAEQNTAFALAAKQEGERQMGELRKEWGGEFDKNIELGKQALHHFGISKEVIGRLESQVGAAQIVKTFSQIGAALSEGTLNPGGGGRSDSNTANWYPNSNHK